MKKPQKAKKERKPRKKRNREKILVIDGVLPMSSYARMLKEARNKFDYDFIVGSEFTRSQAWRTVRYVALARSTGKCECCGRGVHLHGVVLNVDHIKPRKLFPELALCLDNLQVLCAECNQGKLSGAMIDHRSPDPHVVEVDGLFL